MSAESHGEPPSPAESDSAPESGSERRTLSRRFRWAWIAAGLLVLASIGWMRLSIGDDRFADSSETV